jgi:D-arabinose 1-dehydrogenase-like Zn-dependent alcohol dehydrogenase
MKAWILRIPAAINEDPLQLTESQVPSPCDDELLLRVSVCGICRTDFARRRGRTGCAPFASYSRSSDSRARCGRWICR